MAGVSTSADLVKLGWRDGSAESVRHFQRGWNLGAPLKEDGSFGPATRAALDVSLARKAKGLTDFSPNFNAVEFRCKCGEDGRTVAPDCDRIWIYRSTVRRAEIFRTLVGPYTPERGCRCERENTRVDGAKSSQHLVGHGIDVPIYDVTVAQVRAALGTVGIGTYEKGGRLYVRHFDDRGTWAQWPYPYKPFTPLKARPDLAVAPLPTSEEDDMSSIMVKHPTLPGVVWPLETAVWSTWSSALKAENNSKAALAEVGAMSAAVAEFIAKGSDLTLEDITAASKAGAAQALEEKITDADVVLKVEGGTT